LPPVRMPYFLPASCHLVTSSLLIVVVKSSPATLSATAAGVLPLVFRYSLNELKSLVAAALASVSAATKFFATAGFFVSQSADAFLHA